MDVAAMTLDRYLDAWLELLRTRMQPTTYRSYDDMVHSYLRPVLGRCLVGEFTAHQLNLHFVYLLQQGGRRGGPLERSTVKYAHAILRQAFGKAVRDGLLDDNVAARAAPPRHDPERGPAPDSLRTWDRAQAARFLELTAGQALHGLWCLALGTGMRRGELLGLTWEDVDLEVPQVRVRTSLTHVQGRRQLKSTKNRRGRVLALDAATAAVIARQPPPRHDEWPMVFTRPYGLPWRHEMITDRWRRQWPRLDLPKLTLHSLRHCHACLLLDQGVLPGRRFHPGAGQRQPLVEVGAKGHRSDRSVIAAGVSPGSCAGGRRARHGDRYRPGSPRSARWMASAAWRS